MEWINGVYYEAQSIYTSERMTIQWNDLTHGNRKGDWAFPFLRNLGIGLL